MKFICDKSQYIKNCDTEKSFAIQYSKYDNHMMFLPKSMVKIKEIVIEKYGQYWSTKFEFEIPEWLFYKLSEKDIETINLIQKEWKQENNL
tara:strand:+ start:7114 stop:7386 length:273 start_codon:yes stop_codon:yes gene_type:complete